MPIPCEENAGRPGSKPATAPRIAIRDGQFISTDTGNSFFPRGFNYTRMESPGIRHNVFNTGSYDADRASGMFLDVAGQGFNMVRVFMPEWAVDDPASHDHISDEVFDNLLDFLEKARAHGVRVILSMLHCPASMVKEPFSGMDDPDFVFNESRLQAKALYHRNVIRRIRSRDPGLLSTVFSHEHGNELCFYADRHPFAMNEGMLNFAGRSYNMESAEEIQRLTDDGTLRYARILNDAVKEEDPDALFSINIFTFSAVGRTGPGRLHLDKTQDRRFPARALVLASSDIDYLDIHLYSEDLRGSQRDLESIEWGATRELLVKNGKPAIIGEIGIYRDRFTDPESAAGHVRMILPVMLKSGMQGFLYWTYDSDEQYEQLWHARDRSNPAILTALKGIHPDLC